MPGRHRTHKRPSRVAAGGLVRFPLRSQMAIDSSVCTAELHWISTDESCDESLHTLDLPLDTYSWTPRGSPPEQSTKLFLDPRRYTYLEAASRIWLRLKAKMTHCFCGLHFYNPHVNYFEGHFLICHGLVPGHFLTISCFKKCQIEDVKLCHCCKNFSLWLQKTLMMQLHRSEAVLAHIPQRPCVPPSSEKGFRHHLLEKAAFAL